MLLHLFVFKRLPFLFPTVEQVVFLFLHARQFLYSLGYLLLHRLDSLALSPLENSIFPHKAQATEHL